MCDSLVVSVAVDGAVYQIDRPFDYFVPPNLRESAKVGCRVLVPFGRGNVKKTGIILKYSDECELSKLKPVLEVLDKEPILSAEMLEIAAYLKEQTLCTWYSALRVLLPPGINYKIKSTYSVTEAGASAKLEAAEQQIVEFVSSLRSPPSKDSVYDALGLSSDCGLLEKLVSKGVLLRSDAAVRNIGDATLKMIRATEAIEDASNIKLTPKQRQAVAVLRDIGCCSVKELCYFTGLSLAVINGLPKKGVAEIFEEEYYRNPYSSGFVAESNDIQLTECQQTAFDTLCEKYENGGGTALLYGVTGSGKTQVFLKMCEKVAKEGRGVIVMVPEIALTPQTLDVFHRRFGDKVAVFHSAMSQGQRLDEWKRVKNGDAMIAVGTRSAVFAPFSDVGLIIMDEEHEHTYKSEMSPHFHARDVARFRAKQSSGMVILSSATPSLESYSQALSGNYTLCKLGRRFGNAGLPDVETVDMRKEQAKGNRSIISNTLYDYIDEALANGNQAILLLNRRGFNTYISCPNCRTVMNCENCSISLTYHSANNRLMCHYCGTSVPYADKCPVCGSDRMKYSGIGTQKAEEELAELFPEAKILRMDADSTSSRTDYERNLSDFAEGKYDILLGTQMVAKGLNFPKVTVVGVLNADMSMQSPDFRSYERTFSLLTQVVGRSGRGDKKGVAVIQTNDPDSNIIELASRQDYEAFYKTEIMTRKLMVYPPYCNIATVVFSGENRSFTEESANYLLSLIKQFVGAEYSGVKLRVLGPTAASVLRVNNCYRYKLIIKYKNSKDFRNMMSGVLTNFNKSQYAKHTSAYIDVNPDSII
ncbi:MAG: primosomal protein N' [Ruminococcaceae bacterium]|nr:primosomal protein N' [Oscillospiraceae bacterium]